MTPFSQQAFLEWDLLNPIVNSSRSHFDHITFPSVVSTFHFYDLIDFYFSIAAEVGSHRELVLWEKKLVDYQGLKITVRDKMSFEQDQDYRILWMPWAVLETEFTFGLLF